MIESGSVITSHFKNKDDQALSQKTETSVDGFGYVNDSKIYDGDDFLVCCEEEKNKRSSAKQHDRSIVGRWPFKSSLPG